MESLCVNHSPRINVSNPALNRDARYQKGLTVNHLFPKRNDNTCSCGCGVILTGNKRKWASRHCREESVTLFLIIKGDIKIIRRELFKRDKGKCSGCGQFSAEWEADHIIPVFLGGGACLMDNFQTLCLECHNKKTASYSTLSHNKAISLQAASICDQRLLIDTGAGTNDSAKVSYDIQISRLASRPEAAR